MPQVSQITVKDADGVNRDVATVTELVTRIGEVSATPTANTLLDRLKTIATSLGTMITSLGTMITSLGSIDSASTASATSLSTLDDWDEFDRAKVNIIAGQAGVSANAGAGDASTVRVIAASDDPGVTRLGLISKAVAGDYEAVSANSTAQVLGATGAAGDYLSHIVITPATLSPGAVSITDGAGSAMTIFTGGASSILTLHPFTVPLSMKSSSGAWKVTTGDNVSVVAAGDFT